MVEPESRASRPKPLSQAEWAARKPLPPDVLADARHEKIHRDLGGGRVAKCVRASEAGPRVSVDRLD